MKKLIAYFFNRPLLTNIIFILTMGMAIFAWKNFVSKEEMPEFASNWVRINISYPGAAAEDVELFKIFLSETATSFAEWNSKDN